MTIYRLLINKRYIELTYENFQVTWSPSWFLCDCWVSYL